MSLLRVPEECPFFYIVEYSIKLHGLRTGNLLVPLQTVRGSESFPYTRFLDGFRCENNALLDEEVSLP